jgi:CMP-N,N'-diacetyllegionaminic acid synthase
VSDDRRATCWAFVPARGGSKSIHYKNLVMIGGRPLLDYGVLAAQASGQCGRIVGSTEDARIAERFAALGVECDQRPAKLATDDAPVADVVREWLTRLRNAGTVLPEILLLVQPTSPFLRPNDITQLVSALSSDPRAQSGQTIVPCAHNAHAWNQRVFANGHVSFVYAEERRRGYNKQTKPERWLFGNLVAARVTALLAGEGFFAEPAIGVPIERPYDFDLDTQTDVAIAAALITSGCVRLPHMG